MSSLKILTSLIQSRHAGIFSQMVPIEEGFSCSIEIGYRGNTEITVLRRRRSIFDP